MYDLGRKKIKLLNFIVDFGFFWRKFVVAHAEYSQNFLHGSSKIKIDICCVWAFLQVSETIFFLHIYLWVFYS
jgi:hypothetical protein